MDVATFRYAAMHPPAGVLRGMPKHKSSRNDREVDNDAKGEQLWKADADLR